MSAASNLTPVALLKLVESTIQSLKYGQKKISQSSAQFLYALLADKNQALVQTTTPYLSDPKPNVPIHDAVHAVLRSEMEKKWEAIFESFTTSEGKRLSKLDRTAMGTQKSTLTYGEVTFDGLAEVIYKHVPLPRKGGVFVDLGSGTGRGIFAACLLHPFDIALGIEILPSLHDAAVRTRDVFRERVQDPEFIRRMPSPRRKPAAAAAAAANSSSASSADASSSSSDLNSFSSASSDAASVTEHSDASVPAELQTDIQLVCGDFLSVDWSHADVVFANSTCYDDALMKLIVGQARALHKGAFFLTLTRPLESPDFKQVSHALYKMSWGQATIYVHTKITEPNAETPLPLSSASSSATASSASSSS